MTFSDLYLHVSAMDERQLATEIRGTDDDTLLTLLNWRAAQIAYTTSARLYETMCEQAVIACAQSFWPTAKVVRVQGDSEGAEFSDRLCAVAVLDGDNNMLASAEAPTEEWDAFDELSREFLDWMIDVNEEWWGNHEIEVPA